MKKATVLVILVTMMLLAVGVTAQAQQPARIHRIGILSPVSGSVFPARVEAFRERLPDLAAELVRLKVDIIVTIGPSATLAAKKASGTMPIVIASAADPVGTGLVSSLAQPGGNITGLSLMAPDLDGKRLELLKEAFPKVVRVAFLWQPGGTRGNLTLTEMETAAKTLRLKLLSLQVRG